MVFVTLFYHSLTEREGLVSLLPQDQLWRPDEDVGVANLLELSLFDLVYLVFELFEVKVVDLTLVAALTFYSDLLGYRLGNLVLHWFQKGYLELDIAELWVSNFALAFFDHIQ